MAVGAPERAAAMAWLAPLPPPKMAKVEPVTVSPASGALATRATRSVLMAPPTRTCPVVVTACRLPDSRAGALRTRSREDRASPAVPPAMLHRLADGRHSALACRSTQDRYAG